MGSKKTEIIVVGSGNVAVSFCRMILYSKRLALKAVVARNEETGKELANRNGTGFYPITSSEIPQADVVIIAVSDAAIEDAALATFPGNPIVVHTAGAISKEVLYPFAKRYGVIYPLQSLSKYGMELVDFPILFDGSDDETVLTLGMIAEELSEDSMQVNDENRLKYHLSAVFVNNFSNHLFTMAYEYCTKNNLDFSLLLPLIKATASKVTSDSPAALQTGPAARHDKITIQKHLELLKDEGELRDVYEMFTEMIGKSRK